MVKSRLDVLLVQKGLAESRTRAQALVMEGKVRVDGQVETKASRQVSAESSVEVEAPPRFVSRGGEKLEGAFRLWGSEEVRVKSEELRTLKSFYYPFLDLRTDETSIEINSSHSETSVCVAARSGR